MKRRNLVATGLSVYLLWLVATAPATLVDFALEDISHGRLRLAEAQGTLWSGLGNVEIRDSRGIAGVAKTLAWRLLPTSLLQGHLVCEVSLEQTTTPFTVTASFSGIKVSNAVISLPAAALGLGIPKLAPLGLSGELLVHIASLSIERQKMWGKAKLQWHNAGSALTLVSPLGDYELDFESQGTSTQVTLNTTQGSLQLDGNGAWESGGDLRFHAVARVPPHHQEQLSPLLRLIAVERSPGSFELQLK